MKRKDMYKSILLCIVFWGVVALIVVNFGKIKDAFGYVITSYKNHNKTPEVDDSSHLVRSYIHEDENGDIYIGGWDDDDTTTEEEYAEKYEESLSEEEIYEEFLEDSYNNPDTDNEIFQDEEYYTEKYPEGWSQMTINGCFVRETEEATYEIYTYWDYELNREAFDLTFISKVDDQFDYVVGPAETYIDGDNMKYDGYAKVVYGGGLNFGKVVYFTDGRIELTVDEEATHYIKPEFLAKLSGTYHLIVSS